MKRENRHLFLGTMTLLGALSSGCASGTATLGPTSEASARESVGMARDGVSPAIEELDRYVLVIQELSGGQVTHSWRRVEKVDLSQFSLQPRAQNAYGRIVLAAARQRDCHAELIACFEECMSTPLPRGYGHIRAPGRGMGAKEVYCNKKCRPAYMDCMELQERLPQEFSTTAEAVDWLKHNRTEVLVGSLVTVAGVAFLVAFPPGAILGGIVALVPVAALASSELLGEPQLKAVAP